MIRVFAGPVPEGHSWEDAAKWMADDLRECADYGKQFGVLVGVQNHGDMLKTADETIKIVDMVNSDWFGVIVDTGYFSRRTLIRTSPKFFRMPSIFRSKKVPTAKRAMCVPT